MALEPGDLQDVILDRSDVVARRTVGDVEGVVVPLIRDLVDEAVADNELAYLLRNGGDSIDVAFQCAPVAAGGGEESIDRGGEALHPCGGVGVVRPGLLVERHSGELIGDRLIVLVTPGHIEPVMAPVVGVDIENGPGDHARQHGEVDLIPVEAVGLEETGEEVSRYVDARGASKRLGVFESDGLDESALPSALTQIGRASCRERV